MDNETAAGVHLDYRKVAFGQLPSAEWKQAMRFPTDHRADILYGGSIGNFFRRRTRYGVTR